MRRGAVALSRAKPQKNSRMDAGSIERGATVGWRGNLDSSGGSSPFGEDGSAALFRSRLFHERRRKNGRRKFRREVKNGGEEGKGGNLQCYLNGLATIHDRRLGP